MSRASSPYTRERLEEAASGARTLSEALERLGVDPRSSSRDYVQRRMKRLGVDTSHFQREGVKWTREILEAAVASSTNVCGVLRHLGLEVVGGQHTYISRRIKAYEIDTSHFTPAARTENQRHNARRRTAEEVLVEQASPHAMRRRAVASSRRCTNSASRSAAPCVAWIRYGSVSRSPSRSTTSTATGATTASRTSDSFAPTAIPRRTVTGAEARGAPRERRAVHPRTAGRGCRPVFRHRPGHRLPRHQAVRQPQPLPLPSLRPLRDRRLPYAPAGSRAPATGHRPTNYDARWTRQRPSPAPSAPWDWTALRSNGPGSASGSPRRASTPRTSSAKRTSEANRLRTPNGPTKSWYGTRASSAQAPYDYAAHSAR